MNFSNHVKETRRLLRRHLSQDKTELLEGLQECTLRARSLLKTSELDFWLEQFELLELKEFPTTAYAVNLVQNFLANRALNADNTRQSLAYEIGRSCKNLLTFTVDDWCVSQTEFHWYFCISGKFTFKESGLGAIEVPKGKEISGKIRIAKISELPRDLQKNVI